MFNSMKTSKHKQTVGCMLLGLILMVIALAACTSEKSAVEANSLPPGDAARGAVLFSERINDTPRCSACHADESTRMGPTLTNYSDVAESRSDLSAYEYTLDAIVRPGRHILRGYSNTMYADYGEKLSTQEIADLIAYMLDS